jgi:hypothetical protein
VRKIVGSVIEGSTTFVFEPVDAELSSEEYGEIIEDVLSCERFDVGKSGDRLYYKVARRGREWSVYHLAVQEDCLTLFARDATTENSVKSFYQLLESETGIEWSVEKEERDLTGTGKNN